MKPQDTSADPREYLNTWVDETRPMWRFNTADGRGVIACAFAIFATPKPFDPADCNEPSDGVRKALLEYLSMSADKASPRLRDQIVEALPKTIEVNEKDGEEEDEQEDEEQCEHCRGTGQRECPHCEGTGELDCAVVGCGVRHACGMCSDGKADCDCEELESRRAPVIETPQPVVVIDGDVFAARFLMPLREMGAVSVGGQEGTILFDDGASRLLVARMNFVGKGDTVIARVQS